ncbi:uncharacterized protein L201_007513 [Kwoniella dendrophila CBS 6074]|uniref:Tyr recombinase domain-containing protein n=1 Tax=Kwoniella dendrophila CBS 6074 TaxID=1295534 RepID=A0AAX4K609_9TREE
MSREGGGTLRQSTKKLTAAELRASRNVTSATTGETARTARKLKKLLRPSTLAHYQREMNQFRQHLAETYFDAQHPENMPTFEYWADGKTVDEVLGDGGPPLTVQILHAYMRWRVGGMSGKIGDYKVPSLASCHINLVTFWNAYEYFTDTYTPNSVLVSADTYINTTLKDEFGLHDETRARRTPDGAVLKDVIINTWSPDLTHTNTLSRVYQLATLAFQGCSASRIGAILRSTTSGYQTSEFDARALCYKDITVHLTPSDEPDDYNIATVDFRLRFTKTKEMSVGYFDAIVHSAAANRMHILQNRPHHLYETAIPGLNGPLFLLIIAIADGAIEDDPSLEWIFDPKCLEGLDTKQIKWKKEWLERPIFRRQLYESPDNMPSNDNSSIGELTHTNKAYSADSYNALLKKACTVAGYPVAFASHDLRTAAIQAMMALDTTRLEVLKLAIGHKLSQDTWALYMQGKNLLNFTDAIFGSGSTADKLSKLNQMSMEKDPNMPLWLSKDRLEQLLDEEDLYNIREEQRRIRSRNLARYGSIDLAPENIKHQLKKLTMEYKNAYEVLYRRYLTAEIQAYREKRLRIPTDPSKLANEIATEVQAIDIASQADAFPSADLVGDCIDAGTSVLMALDFSKANQIVELLKADGTEEDALEQLCKDHDPKRQNQDETSTVTSSRSVAQEVQSQQAGESSTTQTQSQAEVRATTSDHPPPSSFSQTATQPERIAELQSKQSSVSVENFSQPQSSSSIPNVPQETSKQSAVVSSLMEPEETPSPEDASIEGTCYALEAIMLMLMDPSTDKVKLGRMILDLPTKTIGVQGWYPGMMVKKINGVDTCPSCEKPIKDCVSSPKSKKTDRGTLMNKIKTHIFIETRDKAKEEALPDMISSYNQIQACPACLGIKVQELEYPTDQEVDAIKSYLVKEAESKWVLGWSNHFKYNHGAGEICSCGYVNTESREQQFMHLIVRHKLMVCSLGARIDNALRQQSKPTPLGPHHFPDPKYSLLDCAFHPDPAEWEQYCEYEFNQTIKLEGHHTWAARDDMVLLKAERDLRATLLEDLQNLLPIEIDATEQDTRAQAVIIHANSFVCSHFGRCFICLYDETKTWTDRMVYYHDRKDQRAHILLHFIQMFSDNHPHLKKIPANASKKTKSEIGNYSITYFNIIAYLKQIPQSCLPTSEEEWYDSLREFSNTMRLPQAVSAGLVKELRKKRKAKSTPKKSKSKKKKTKKSETESEETEESLSESGESDPFAHIPSLPSTPRKRKTSYKGT